MLSPLPEYEDSITPCLGRTNRNVLTKADEITVPYSDLPKDTKVKVTVIKGGRGEIIMAKTIDIDELESLRI